MGNETIDKIQELIDSSQKLREFSEDLLERYKNLSVLNAELADALKTLIDTYWQNQGSDGKTCPHAHEFISCITPQGIPQYWRNAKKVLTKWEISNGKRN